MTSQAPLPAGIPSCLGGMRALVLRLLESVARTVRRGYGAGPGATVAIAPTRCQRLRNVAFSLEALLDELDELGAQRIAIDVCMALERVKAQLASAVEPDDLCSASYCASETPGALSLTPE